MMLRRTLRIRYSKIGPLRFVGHLDMTRILTRAIARSSIPALYSQGFSPHMRISFTPPLSLGMSSACEYLDLQIDEAEAMNTPDEWRVELQGYGPEGLTIQEVRLLDENAPSLAESFDRAHYQITIPEEFAPTNGKLARFLQQTSMCIEKRSKHGVKTVDIRPGIELLKKLDTGTEKPKSSVYELIIIMGESVPATPALVIKALLGCEWKELHGCRIHRSELYSSAGPV